MAKARATSHDEKVLALRGTVFGRLTPSQLDDVASLSECGHFDAGATLCVQGAFTQDTFVLAHGDVCIEVDGREVSRLGPGAIVGDWALFGDGRRTATVRALTDVEAVVIDVREIDSLLMSVPNAADVLGPRHLAPVI